MPAQRVGRTPVPFQQFDVLGFDSVATPRFITHVGLASGTGALSSGESATMVHMAPPLRIEDQSGPVTSVATATLTADEIKQVETFIDLIEGEYESAGLRDSHRQYCILPHARPRRGGDETIVCAQYSCAGLVIDLKYNDLTQFRFENRQLLEYFYLHREQACQTILTKDLSF